MRQCLAPITGCQRIWTTRSSRPSSNHRQQSIGRRTRSHGSRLASREEFPHWCQIGQVPTTSVPWPGLRRGPAQRGPAGGGVVLSERRRRWGATDFRGCAPHSVVLDVASRCGLVDENDAAGSPFYASLRWRYSGRAIKHLRVREGLFANQRVQGLPRHQVDRASEQVGEIL